MDPDPIASHHFTTTALVQATVISSARYRNSPLNWSPCCSPRICSPLSLIWLPVPSMTSSAVLPFTPSDLTMSLSWSMLSICHLKPLTIHAPCAQNILSLDLFRDLLPYSFMAPLKASSYQRSPSRTLHKMANLSLVLHSSHAQFYSFLSILSFICLFIIKSFSH